MIIAAVTPDTTHGSAAVDGGRCQSQRSWRRAKHASPDKVTSLSSFSPHDYGTLGILVDWREVGSAGGMGGGMSPLIC